MNLIISPQLSSLWIVAIGCVFTTWRIAMRRIAMRSVCPMLFITKLTMTFAAFIARPKQAFTSRFRLPPTTKKKGRITPCYQFACDISALRR